MNVYKINYSIVKIKLGTFLLHFCSARSQDYSTKLKARKVRMYKWEYFCATLSYSINYHEILLSQEQNRFQKPDQIYL